MENLNEKKINKNYYKDLNVSISMEEWHEISQGLDFLFSTAICEIIKNPINNEQDTSHLQTLISFKKNMDKRFNEMLIFL